MSCTLPASSSSEPPSSNWSIAVSVVWPSLPVPPESARPPPPGAVPPGERCEPGSVTAQSRVLNSAWLKLSLSRVGFVTRNGSLESVNSVVAPSPENISVTYAEGSIAPLRVTSLANSLTIVVCSAATWSVPSPCPASKSSAWVTEPTGLRLSAPESTRYAARVEPAIPAALVDQGWAGSGSNTPTWFPLAMPAVVSSPAAMRLVSVASSVPAGTAKPAPVRVAVCLSSSHSSLMALKATR